jgi:HEAT repeat protein
MSKNWRLPALVTLYGMCALRLAAEERKVAFPCDNKPTERLLASLRDEGETADKRALAAVCLGRTGDPAALGPLLAALRDSNPVVCHGAAEGLGWLRDPGALGPLSDAARDDRWPGGGGMNAALTITSALVRIGTDAVEPLIDLLEKPEPVQRYRRYHAARALGAIGDQRAVRPLMAALRTCVTPFCEKCALGGPSLSSAIIGALGRLGDPATEPLLAWLQSRDPVERFWAPLALSGLRFESPVLRDSDGRLTVRPSRDPRIPGALRTALGDRDARVRFSAARSLCLINDAKGLAALAAAVRHRQLAETAGAMACLVKLTPPDQNGVLLDALDTYGDCETAWAMSEEARSSGLRRAGERRFGGAGCSFYED